jgi:serine protease Do
VSALAPGSGARLGVVSKGKERTVTVTLADYPKDQKARVGGTEGRQAPGSETHLGLTLAPAGSVAGSGGKGVVVTEVEAEGPAAERGFKTGDVILEVGSKSVSTPADVRSALSEARAEGKRTVLMRVKSGEATKFVALPLGRV